MSNAISKDSPLSAGKCLHGVPMSENCEGCTVPPSQSPDGTCLLHPKRATQLADDQTHE
jgi:hypothetical protein